METHSPRVLLIGKGSISERHKKAVLSVFPSAEIFHKGTREIESPSNDGDGDVFFRDLKTFAFAVVTSPASHHAEHVLMVVQADVPVLVEKPLTSSLGEAIRLSESLDQHAVPVQVGYVLRHSEGFQIFREQILRIGVSNIKQVTSICHSYLPDWRPEKDYRTSVSAIPSLGGGVLREVSHEFDYLLELFGSITVNSAVLSRHPDFDLGFEAKMHLDGQLTNGAKVNVGLDMFEQEVERWCEVEWTDGTRLRWDVLANSVLLSKNSQTIHQWSSGENRDHWFKKQIQSFIDALEANEKPNPSIDEGVEVMKLIDEIEACATWL